MWCILYTASSAANGRDDSDSKRGWQTYGSESRRPAVRGTTHSAGPHCRKTRHLWPANHPAFQFCDPPQSSLYQYNVSYSPPIESRGLHTGLLSEHTSRIGNVRVFDGMILFLPHRRARLIGNVRAFDGMILFLPHRLPDDVTEVVSTLRHDQSQVNLKITLTNEVAANSPVSLQVFNVIFRRYSL